MDPNIDKLKSDAYTAASNVNSMQTQAPGLLSELKQNLVGIFAKDNPIIGARNTALSDYLSEANNTRASLLPGNTGDVPGLAGRPLTYSPTQQDAMVSSRNAAALAPLAGYNEILKGMYGTIGDMVGNAGNIYSAQIQGANSNASLLEKLYQDAIEEYKIKQSGSASGGLDLPSILASISAALNVKPSTGPSLDDIFGAPGAGGGNGQVTVDNILDVIRKQNGGSIQPSVNPNAMPSVESLLTGKPDMGHNLNSYIKLQPGQSITGNPMNPYMGGLTKPGQNSPFNGLNLNLSF